MLIAKICFLVSVLKGLDSFPKPAFWAVLYVLFIFVSSYMFSLAGGDSIWPILGYMGLNLALSGLYFTALRETDGGVYWLVFGGGLFLLSWIP